MSARPDGLRLGASLSTLVVFAANWRLLMFRGAIGLMSGAVGLLWPELQVDVGYGNSRRKWLSADRALRTSPGLAREGTFLGDVLVIGAAVRRLGQPHYELAPTARPSARRSDAPAM